MQPLILLAALTAPLQADVQAPRAAVFEHADRWTDGATGLAWMLERAGFAVEPLEEASLARVDLVAFGAFANNDPACHELVDAHSDALRAFVAEGGVVLELAQSDQFGARVEYLPEGCDVRRGDEDDATVRAALPEHVLAAGEWIDDSDPSSIDTLGGDEVSWEGLERWTGCQVVLAAGGGERAALVEAAHGRGRFVVSTLWLDKLRRGEELVAPAAQLAAADAFAAGLRGYCAAVRAGRAPAVVPAPAPIERAVGPMVGHVGAGVAHLWMRPTEPGLLTLAVSSDGVERLFEARASAVNDRCVTWRVGDLTPDSTYAYEVRRGDQILAGGPSCRFTTAPVGPARATLAFGSCASSDASPVWSAIELAGADGLVLLGDTPYVDTTDLDAAREKHRRFLEVPELARLARGLPVWGTWDDHDFGKNDSDGTLPGKESTRRAFVEYRALASYGDGDEGIYTSFRRGPLEVFLLDTRSFARTEVDHRERPTLLGAAQWRWLEAGLAASSAPFKILACGMIWDDKQNSESDDWGSYPHERERLERLLGERGIAGAVLVGGDIHVSRHLRYVESAARVGYVIDQLIVSPLHDRVIPSLDVPHPALQWSAREPHVFLLLEGDSTSAEPRLVARWMQDTGRGAGRELRRVEWTLGELSPAR